MARTVTDAAIPPHGDERTRSSATRSRSARRRSTQDYAANLDAEALKGARIGVSRAVHFGYSAAADRLIEVAVDAMKAQGAVVVDPVEIPNSAGSTPARWKCCSMSSRPT
jgi:amidase